MSLIVGPLLAHPLRAKERTAAVSTRSLPGSRAETSRTVGDLTLKIHIFEPAGHLAADRLPAIVFFFGGGWRTGSPRQFEQHCRYLASRGMVAMTADYRVASRHGTQSASTPYGPRAASRIGGFDWRNDVPAGPGKSNLL